MTFSTIISYLNHPRDERNAYTDLIKAAKLATPQVLSPMASLMKPSSPQAVVHEFLTIQYGSAASALYPTSWTVN